MKVRYLIAVSTVLLAIVGMTIAQQQPKPVGPIPLPPEPMNMLPAPAVQPQPIPMSHPVQPAPTTEGKPESMTIEQLMDAVDEFREQKAELDRKEKAYLKVMQRKAAKQKDRMDSITGEVPPARGVPSELTTRPGSPETPPPVVRNP